MKNSGLWAWALSVLTGLLFMVPVLTGGCGSSQKARPVLYPTEGVVTFDGKPLESGQIVFESISAGISTMAELQSAGKFVVKDYQGSGLPAGDYVVYFQLPKMNLPLGPIPPEIQKVIDSFPVPTKYRDPKTSGLTAKIAGGQAAGALKFDLVP